MDEHCRDKANVLNNLRVGERVNTLLGFLFPQNCIACSKQTKDSICPACIGTLSKSNPPVCSFCGKPRMSDFPSPDCDNCFGQKFRFDLARHLFLYDDHSSQILQAIKFKGKFGGGLKLADIIIEELKMRGGVESLFGVKYENPDFIIPVPISPLRKQKRGGYNQVVVLFHKLEKLVKVKMLPYALTIAKDEPQAGIRRVLFRHLPIIRSFVLVEKKLTPQVGLSFNQRKENVRNAFAVGNQVRSMLQGKVVLLVDDLITTGATLSECARALKKNGVKKVLALTVFSTSQKVF